MRHLYRDPQRGLVGGVCIGVAEYFDLPVWLVRVAVLVLAWYWLAPIAVAYVIASLLMPKKPLYFQVRTETGRRAFWRVHTRRG